MKKTRAGAQVIARATVMDLLKMPSGPRLSAGLLQRFTRVLTIGDT